ncbi:glycosyltransferase family 4 protein [Pseudarthrobacter sp. AB1]|uniref:glycosyltransferase n=1 Tax=Pseudarthrobacter sp. AB1 TaxID=2138309 RepID=UPI00186B72BE|nr:glycosyltransferase family 4 protein [Pseudarthrobacter sp. AB1]MBE4717478.1 hypothetical protein [Pseudarthrobacter sp. AB1]
MNTTYCGPSVLSLTLFVPYARIPHAGGEYVYRHYAQLSETSSLQVIAPRNADNEEASLLSSNESYKISLIDRAIQRPTKMNLAWLLTVKYIRGVSLGIDTERGVRRSQQIHSLVKDVEFVEFQWTETASLSRYFRKIAPAAIQVLVAHDVLSQRWGRRLKSETSIRNRIFYFGRFIFSRLAERRRFEAVDRVVVFSQKDADLVRQICSTADIRVINPPLMDSGMLEWSRTKTKTKSKTTPAPPIVLFTGALSRIENHEAIVWFINEVWEDLKAEIPNCVLMIAGAGPQPDLVELTENHVDIVVTGRVKDLAPYYKDADVFISPMLNGAGVKFKNITAMLWGVPILSTSVGAEGIGSNDLYLNVTDNTSEFLESLSSALKDSELRRSVSARAQRWAFSKYGDAQFANELQRLYDPSTSAFSVSE